MHTQPPGTSQPAGAAKRALKCCHALAVILFNSIGSLHYVRHVHFPPNCCATVVRAMKLLNFAVEFITATSVEMCRNIANKVDTFAYA